MAQMKVLDEDKKSKGGKNHGTQLRIQKYYTVTLSTVCIMEKAF